MIELDVLKTYQFLNHKSYTEVRVLSFENGKTKKLANEFVDNETAFLSFCKKWEGKGNIYVGINSRKEKLNKPSSGDNIDQINSFIIDLDPNRTKGLPSSNEELLDTINTSLEIYDHFFKSEFKEPVINMSGNGVQLWFSIYPINIHDDNREIISSKLSIFSEMLKKLWDNDNITQDNMTDLPRIIKVIGTQSIKGKYELGRPLRVSKNINKFIGRNLRSFERFDDLLLTEYILSLKTDVKASNSQYNNVSSINYDKKIDVKYMAVCKFYDILINSPESVTEKMWYDMLSHMARFGEKGKELAVHFTRIREKSRKSRYRKENEIFWKINRIKKNNFGGIPCNKMEWKCPNYPCMDGLCTPIRLLGINEHVEKP